MTKPIKRPSAPRPLVTARDRIVLERARWLPGVDRPDHNVCESVLRRLEWLGVITAAQREAGERFEADVRLVGPNTSPRDSLDLTPRGEGHESEDMVEAIKRAKARLRKVKVAAGVWYSALRVVAVDRREVKLAAIVLPDVLDRVARVYGLEGR